MIQEKQNIDMNALHERASDVLGAIESLLGDAPSVQEDDPVHPLHLENEQHEAEIVNLTHLITEVRGEVERLKVEVARSHATALASIQHQRESILSEARSIVHQALIKLSFDEPRRKGYSSTSGDHEPSKENYS